MQGRTVTSGVKMTLTDHDGVPVFGPYSAISTGAMSSNLSFSFVKTGTYLITTSQARYLNVTAGLERTLLVDGNKIINPLKLRGGNAVWTGHATSNNIIDLADANKVGIDWGPSGSSDLTINHGDVNFDGKVNIQDLALVGGNFDLTSVTAYGGWLTTP